MMVFVLKNDVLTAIPTEEDLELMVAILAPEFPDVIYFFAELSV